MERKLDYREQLADAEAAGMRAVVLKDHFHSTAPITRLMDRHRPQTRVTDLYSGVALNNALGGLNPYAVEHSLMMGARIVWMPTLCSSNHLRTAFRYNLSGKLDMERPMAIDALTPKGAVRDELKVILDLIAAHDAVLSGGHLHVSEMYPLFEEAKARGVTRMLVSHPTFWVEADVRDLTELSAMGVYLEHCACMLIDCPSRKYSSEQMIEYIEASGIDQTILGSDLGQPFNPRPVDGMRSVIRLCLELGFSEQAVRKLTALNACQLLGIEPLDGSATAEQVH